jgi:D-xylose reductase
MTKEDLDEICGLDRGLRFNDPGSYLPERPIRIFD